MKTTVIDLCQETLCAKTASHEVTLSSGGEHPVAKLKLCQDHNLELTTRAMETGRQMGIEVSVTARSISEVA